MSAPKPKRGRKSEEGLSVAEEVTFDATNDPSVAELEDLRVEDENEVHQKQHWIQFQVVVHLGAKFSSVSWEIDETSCCTHARMWYDIGIFRCAGRAGKILLTRIKKGNGPLGN